MTTLVIRGAKEVAATLAQAEKQAPFALSVAINESLKDAQQFTVKELLPGEFTLRKRSVGWWEPRQRFGFNIRPFAKKTSLEGRMGSRADWLTLHETGGRKTGGGHRVAIPSETWRGKREILRRTRRPRALRSAAEQGRTRSGVKPFLLPSGLFARFGGIIRPLFQFVGSARIKRSLNFVKRAGAVARKAMPRHFSKAFKRAIRTAK